MSHNNSEGITFLNPDARCPVCRATVYYYRAPSGWTAYLDTVKPWIQHPCTSGEIPSNQETRFSSDPNSLQSLTVEDEVKVMLLYAFALNAPKHINEHSLQKFKTGLLASLAWLKKKIPAKYPRDEVITTASDFEDAHEPSEIKRAYGNLRRRILLLHEQYCPDAFVYLSDSAFIAVYPPQDNLLKLYHRSLSNTGPWTLSDGIAIFLLPNDFLLAPTYIYRAYDYHWEEYIAPTLQLMATLRKYWDRFDAPEMIEALLNLQDAHEMYLKCHATKQQPCEDLTQDINHAKQLVASNILHLLSLDYQTTRQPNGNYERVSVIAQKDRDFLMAIVNSPLHKHLFKNLPASNKFTLRSQNQPSNLNNSLALLLPDMRLLERYRLLEKRWQRQHSRNTQLQLTEPEPVVETEEANLPEVAPAPDPIDALCNALSWQDVPKLLASMRQSKPKSIDYLMHILVIAEDNETGVLKPAATLIRYLIMREPAEAIRQFYDTLSKEQQFTTLHYLYNAAENAHNPQQCHSATLLLYLLLNIVQPKKHRAKIRDYVRRHKGWLSEIM